MSEATFVFRHSDEKEARRFCKELFETYPFCGDGPTQVIACATGDAMSVSDAVRAALMCNSLDAYYERTEFALAMCECVNWDGCMKLAGEWDLRYDQGEFVDARTEQVVPNEGSMIVPNTPEGDG
jgi:hypothetical protein